MCNMLISCHAYITLIFHTDPHTNPCSGCEKDQGKEGWKEENRMKIYYNGDAKEQNIVDRKVLRDETIKKEWLNGTWRKQNFNQLKTKQLKNYHPHCFSLSAVSNSIPGATFQHCFFSCTPKLDLNYLIS